MKLALLSDIHANRQAWDACLAHAHALGAEQVAVLGDLVGYGGEPIYIVEQARALQAQGGWVLQGNHDAMAVRPPAAGEAAAQSLGAQGAAWTHAQLGDALRAYLAALPLTARVGPALLVHASADQPGRWHYVEDEAAATRCLDAALRDQPDLHLVACGHVHHQALYYRGASGSLMRFAPTPGVPIPIPRHRRWVATIGSVGQPRDGDPRAMWALLDTERATLRFERTPYAVATAAQAIRASGALPDEFAQRLEKGR